MACPSVEFVYLIYDKGVLPLGGWELSERRFYGRESRAIALRIGMFTSRGVAYSVTSTSPRAH